MGNEIFTKKSMDKVASPDRLDDYLNVSNPGVWMVMIAIVLLLVGVCVWGIFGNLDTVLKTAVVSNDGTLEYYIKQEDIGRVEVGMEVNVNDERFSITAISDTAVELTADTDEYILHLGDFSTGEWVYIAESDGNVDSGIYPADIIIESVAPLSFITN